MRALWIQSNRSRRRGFSLVEATFSIGVLSLGFLSLVPLLAFGLKTARQARDNRTTVQIAQTLIEEAKQGTLPSGPLSLDLQGNIPTSISNSDGTLTISPTTGPVVASLALSHANTWSGVQTLQAPVIEDSGGKQVIGTVAVASAVNYINVNGNPTLSTIGPGIQAAGSDTNIPLSIYSKGTGKVFINQINTGFDNNGNLFLFSDLNFLQSGAGIVGTTSNNNASSGVVGEYLSSNLSSSSAISLSTATASNVTSISLTAGDWDVTGNINFAASAATVTATSGGISTTSATVPADGTEVYSGFQTTTLSTTDSITPARRRVSIASTTTVYLVAKCTFSAGSVSAFGSISARRVR